MQKAIYSAQQGKLCKLLKRMRKEAGLTQEQLGARLEVPQSLISDYERGERRLDIIELGQICACIGITLTEFVARFENI